MTLNIKHSDLIKWFQLTFPQLVKDMKNADHHYDEENLNPYHLEGDVWTHTNMVFKNSEIFSTDNDYVKWSTLLHDIGKFLAMETVEKHVDFGDLTDEEVYEKYKYLVDKFIEKEN